MKLLLTAFDPFGGDKVNPALEAVKLVSEKVGNVEVTKVEVPTVFRKSIATVAAAIAKEKPDAVLCIGQAGGRYDITPERVAINLDDARIKDNEGNQPIDVPIYEDGAPAYFSDLPIKAMVQHIREAGLPASVSNTAGTFVCNHLMYGVLYTLAKEYPGVRGGFMHVPFIPEQVVGRPAPAPSMNLKDIARGIEAAIAAIGEYEEDIRTAEGQRMCIGTFSRRGAVAHQQTPTPGSRTIRHSRVFHFHIYSFSDLKTKLLYNRTYLFLNHRKKFSNQKRA